MGVPLRRLDASNHRRDEMRRRRDALPLLRQEAAKQLTAAVASNHPDELHAAVTAAKAAALQGDGKVDGVGGGVGKPWVVTEVRDAYVALAALETSRTERDAGARRREALREEATRAMPLGLDRFGRRHWALEMEVPETAPPPIKVDEPPAIGQQPSEGGAGAGAPSARLAPVGEVAGGFVVWVQPPTSELQCILRAPSADAAGSSSAKKDDDDSDSDDDVPLAAKAAALTSPEKPKVEPRTVEVPTMEGWARHVGEEQCTELTKGLDARGHLERHLKSNLTMYAAGLVARRELRERDAKRAADDAVRMEAERAEVARKEAERADKLAEAAARKAAAEARAKEAAAQREATAALGNK